ncbi:carbohydrate ABC transporter permease, partial [Micromonospora sp. M51]|nr:carbohydrate ABC transporter permease [Micromonospora sp. M51]
MTVNRAQRTRGLVLHLVCVLVGALIVVPVWFGVLGGFKDNGQLSTNPLGWPDPWLPSNYTDILMSEVFWRQLGNSLLIAVSSTVIVVAAAAMAAFVFARYAFRGREFLVTLFAIGLMVPFAV